MLFARTGGPGPRGVSAFLVPTGTPGFGRTEIHGKLGLRGQVTSELTFTDVRVPAGAMLGAEGEGFKIAMHSLDKGRVSVAAGCIGHQPGLPGSGRRVHGKPVTVRAADCRISS